ncbi:MAG: hypothetical protein IPN55_06450 [Saprospiraceae bacterium]|nr:hypothetical protein [Candidatus Brachybacter algidus]
MEFTQEISKQEYKKAILRHYFAFGFTYINPIAGVTLILVFLFMIFPIQAFEKIIFVFIGWSILIAETLDIREPDRFNAQKRNYEI